MGEFGNGVYGVIPIKKYDNIFIQVGLTGMESGQEEDYMSLDLVNFEPSAMDSYFEKQDNPTVFLVLGKETIVDDERLAMALSRLPQLRREVLLLYYFIGYRDEAIGRLYGRCRSTINHRRNVALKQLRKEWERLKIENEK